MDKYIFPGIMVLLIAVFFICTQIMGTTVRKKIMEKIAQGAKIIDVRTPAEFAVRHYEGAINIPLDQIGSNLSLIGPKDKPVILYCASGARSASAAGILKQAGFLDVTNAGSIANMPK